jgi:hypothetical protein
MKFYAVLAFKPNIMQYIYKELSRDELRRGMNGACYVGSQERVMAREVQELPSNSHEIHWCDSHEDGEEIARLLTLANPGNKYMVMVCSVVHSAVVSEATRSVYDPKKGLMPA